MIPIRRPYNKLSINITTNPGDIFEKEYGKKTQIETSTKETSSSAEIGVVVEIYIYITVTIVACFSLLFFMRYAKKYFWSLVSRLRYSAPSTTLPNTAPAIRPLNPPPVPSLPNTAPSFRLPYPTSETKIPNPSSAIFMPNRVHNNSQLDMSKVDSDYCFSSDRSDLTYGNSENYCPSSRVSSWIYDTPTSAQSENSTFVGRQNIKYVLCKINLYFDFF